MSDPAPRELKILVERVVRPLPLPLVWQRRLRTEYLAHLEAVYSEELIGNNDPVAALARTTERFGDPTKISEELLETIGWSKQWAARQEKFFTRQKGGSAAGYVLRLVSTYLAMVVPLLLGVVVAKHEFHPGAIPLLEFRLLAALIAFLALFLGSTFWLSLRWGEEWLKPSRNYGTLSLYFLGLVTVWPLSLLLMMFISGANWDQYSNPKLPVAALMAWGILFTSLIGIFVGIAQQRDTVYRWEWADLEIS